MAVDVAVCPPVEDTTIHEMAEQPREALLHGICAVLRLHGGEMEVSLLGDELRRRHPDLWRNWQRHVVTTGGGRSGLLRVCVEHGAIHGISVASAPARGGKSTQGVPIVRCAVNSTSGTGDKRECSGDGVIINAVHASEAAATEKLRRAVLGKLFVAPHESGRVPLMWLAVACARETSFHIRYSPEFEGDGPEHVEPVDLGGEVPAESYRETRKVRAVRRLKAFVLCEKERLLFCYEAGACSAIHHKEHCCCQGFLRLTETGREEAAALAASKVLKTQVAGTALAGRAGGRAVEDVSSGEKKRAWKRHEDVEAPKDAETVDASILAAAGARQGDAFPEVWILLLRYQARGRREADLMVTELAAAAEKMSVPAEALIELSAGVWAVVETSPGIVTPVKTFIMNVAPKLVSVRSVLVLLTSALRDQDAFVLAVPDVLNSRSTTAKDGCAIEVVKSWFMEFELRERPLDVECLPFRPCPGAMLAFRVASEVATRAPQWQLPQTAQMKNSAQHSALVAIELRSGSLLLCERFQSSTSRPTPPEPCSVEPMAVAHCNLTETNGHGEAASSGQVDMPHTVVFVGECVTADWHGRWIARPFQFSGCLDSHVAAAILSLAVLAWRDEEVASVSIGSPSLRSKPRLIDACSGSGTFAAAGVVSDLFAGVVSVEVDIDRCGSLRQNLRYAEVDDNVDVVAHDARLPFPKALTELPPDIVVCNPPWGWRCTSPAATSSLSADAADVEVGKEKISGGDAESIVLNLLQEFPRAVHALVCPQLPGGASGAGLNAFGFGLRHRCPLGQSAVWIVSPLSRDE
eukprot:TRINITY_DN67880_c0_g1_i1.p1 TRINITY_DN67880_c0_g1~~TRINITY_DN67880_c0_g1_i1.p1  ORF type:complete len:807 (-),score=116.97 TRINITY_DN67880_c0_g1_i1:571-2991(-)